MEDNNNEKNGNREHYTESSGTGTLSAIIFLIIAIAVLYLLSRFL